MNIATILDIAGAALSLVAIGLSFAAMVSLGSLAKPPDPLRFEKDYVRAWQMWRRGKPPSDALWMLNELRLDGHISDATARKLATKA